MDGQSLFGEVVTDLAARKDARALVRKAFADYPLSVLEAGPVDEKPKVISKSEKDVTLLIRVRFMVSQKKFDTFADSLKEVLGKVAKGRGESTLTTKEGDPVHRGENRQLSTYFTGKKSWSDLIPKVIPRVLRPGVKAGQQAILLNTQRTRKLDRSEWTYYLIDEEIGADLKKRAGQDIQARLVLADGDGKVIATDRFPAVSRAVITAHANNLVAPPPSTGFFPSLPSSSTRAASYYTPGYMPAFYMERKVTLACGGPGRRALDQVRAGLRGAVSPRPPLRSPRLR